MPRQRKEPGFYKRLNNLSSADGLERSRSQRRRGGRDSTYEVKSLLDKRIGHDDVGVTLLDVRKRRMSVLFGQMFFFPLSKENEYLVEWQGFSRFEATWEPSSNLSEDLVRAYEDGVLAPGLVSDDELLAAGDNLICAVQRKIKSGSSLAESCPCRRDILVHWFGDKPTKRGAWILTREDFPKKYFPPGWDCVLDVHGQGPRVMYPMHIRSTVRRSAVRFVKSGDVMAHAQQAVYPHASMKFGTEQTSV